MIHEYFYEIIASIVILTMIVIYFLTRKFNHQAQEYSEYINDANKKPINDSYIEEIEEPAEIDYEVAEEETTDDTFIFSGQEEGSFGDIQNNPFEENQEIIEAPQKSLRQKCEVPVHGKISKENFNEFSGVKLLVAEDNVINQKVIQGLLSDTGIEITIADDGQIALDILAQNSDFDMVLMDAHMPRVDGFEATRQIRANPNYEHIVVVALSGDTAADDIRKMTESGMEEHLEKPLRMDDFYDILYAYTMSSDDTCTHDFVEVIMTKELNGDKGLNVCGGDLVFYKDILSEFTTTYTDTSHELIELLERKETVVADALLLDFIGITANIGADNIRSIALELKEAIKDIEEQSYVTILDDFEVHLRALLKDIAAYK